MRHGSVRLALSLASIAATLSMSACERAVQYAVARNGGVGPSRATCDTHALVLERPVRVAPRAAPGCAEGTASTTTPGATFVYWQLEGSNELLGPVASNEVRVQLLGPELMDSEGAAREGGGRGSRDSATGDAPIAPAPGAPAAAGPTNTTSSAATPAIAVVKVASRDAMLAGDTVEFRIEVRLTRDVRLQRLVVVDHVDAWLRITEAHGAQTVRGPGGSTLLIWDTTTVPHGGDESMVVRFSAFARSPNYERTP